MSVLAGSLALVMLGTQAGWETAAQQAIPDAPKAQSTLPDLRSVAPGQGTTSSSTDGSTPDGSSGKQPASVPASPAAKATGAQAGSGQGSPTSVYGNSVEPPAGQGVDASRILHVRVDYKELAFTVKDSKGRPVPGLEPRDVQVYENGLRQEIRFFSTDAWPLSVALVIDQSMTKDEMDRVNSALGALPDAFTQYDEVAVFTYNKSIKEQTEFTGAQSPRLTQTIERSKGEGRDALNAGDLEGPMTCTTCINGYNVDPNTASQRGQSTIMVNVPREIHPLNDAILKAATALSTRPIERRRVIYVISDGKDYGSEAKTEQVKKYLQMHAIEVDGTLVGDSAIWGIGVLDRISLPLMMRDNILPTYAKATGGNVDAEFRPNSMEKSFARIAEEVRTRYTMGYYTHEPFVDGKYRKLEVVVLNHGNDLTVMAPPGYWPMAVEMRPQGPPPTH
ncbi:MAG: VWA domain-containing protein [Acidobacteriaceae bacterium]